ncbi:murein transglycosylase [Aeromonas allosaccharophila]|uniref:membrane-bound lytic murein transglycosylase MltC n=1 Tax=Aeromonas TaxID=642 RepID=UPI000718275B|nr:MULTISPECIES: membrane-bound lytic murein transglycosylase MltC [Aeromonas]KRW60823.1 murein transglycosylase [Aeromonas allosaccharophila]OLF21622.1 lytic murein transglycosylase [Aeromonas sp. YN13HZO-058]TNI94128.1 murein transglycosylase C [Aeromonas allosaccharophila]BBT82015.1 membrane-bound lytic murein transglycosylase C [Aeromonas veronii]
MGRIFWLLCTLLFLSACSSSPKPSGSEDDDLVNGKDIRGFEHMISALSHNVNEIWGREALFAGKFDYVKYTDQYKSRAHIDFSSGHIMVETVSGIDPRAHLRRAIIETLLTPDDPAEVDLYSDREILTGGEPFLYGQVLDNQRQPIRASWRAERYADYLLSTAMKKRTLGIRTIFFVDIPMVANHEDRRGYKYAGIIREASRKYGVPESLIYAVIKTESSFNPYAVSHANAYGLMQVIPATAGRDVYVRVKGKNGQPTREELFNPAYNIDVGTAYLHLLQTVYLADIEDPRSRRYAVISAYNGGAGGVLNTFSSDRKAAPGRINQLSPEAVYQVLTEQHPKEEARRYLYKVNQAEKGFKRTFSGRAG